jgi:hypothetical protein
MLELLSLRKGTTLTKEMFLNHLYGGMDEPELKIIDVFICKLRKKLANATGGRNYIETVWGRGYVLREPAALLWTSACGTKKMGTPWGAQCELVVGTCQRKTKSACTASQVTPATVIVVPAPPQVITALP